MSAMTILPELTPEGAERLSERISGRLETIATNYVAVMPLIREAINRNAHAVLGYASPGAYIKDRFGDSLGKLGAELRREVVKELSAAGLSTRAIAPVVGVSREQVRRDAGDTFVSPAPIDVTPDLPPRDDDWSPIANPITGEVLPDDSTVTETHTVKIVTGLDGKTYKSPEAKPDRRRSLVDDAYKANTDLWKAIERIREITRDDRYSRNKADIKAALQPSVDLALEVLSSLATPEQEK